MGAEHLRPYWKKKRPPPDEEPLIWQAPDLPSIKILRSQYRSKGLFDWTTLKVNVLCRQIKCAPEEVCAAAGYFDFQRIAIWKERSDHVWPVYLAIHFRKLEDQIHRMKFKFEPMVGPGPEDIAMAKLIARGLEPQGRPLVETLGGLGGNIPNGPFYSTECVGTDGCKATTETLKP